MAPALECTAAEQSTAGEWRGERVRVLTLHCAADRADEFLLDQRQVDAGAVACLIVSSI
jgi:hypothetical protein